MDDALIELDEQERMTWLNAPGEELLGTTSQQAQGQLLNSFLPGLPLNRIPQLPRLGQDTNDASAWGEVARCASDPPRLVRARMIAMRAAEAGNHARRVLVLRDVTEVERMRRSLELNERLISLGQLAAGMVHEINNPLTSLFGQTFELAQTLATRAAEERGPAGEAWNRIVGCVAELEQSLRHVAELVATMGDFSKASGRGARAGNVEGAVRWAVRATASEMRGRGRVVASVPPLPTVALDETRLKQVLLNLLLNAAKALDPKHESANVVRVSAFERGASVIISVSDTGCGISAATAARIFEPFFTTRPDGEGTGLGLSVSASIIESAGGSIDVTSEAGRGCTFRVALPLAVASTLEPAPSLPNHDQPNERARVLLVSHDQRLLSATVRALSRDYSVVPVDSGWAALARLDAGEHFDVVVCDAHLPDMTGAYLRTRLEHTSPELARRFVFLSEAGFRPVEQLTATCASCLHKPICFHELSALIVRQLRTEPDSKAATTCPNGQ